MMADAFCLPSHTLGVNPPLVGSGLRLSDGRPFGRLARPTVVFVCHAQRQCIMSVLGAVCLVVGVSYVSDANQIDRPLGENENDSMTHYQSFSSEVYFSFSYLH